MVTQSWFHTLWPKKNINSANGEKACVTVLSFEAASLMAKLVHIWQSLMDKQVAKLREEVSNSVGIRNLISENDDYIVGLICAEITENVVHIAQAVSRLSKKCNDPILRGFDLSFNNLVKNGDDGFGWRLSWKKMERKVKKMERFVRMNNNLYRAMEMLADLEQGMKKMQGGDHSDNVYERKVGCKRREVRRLKESSIWSRSYDYTVLLLVRCLFTVYLRIEDVFGISSIGDSRFLDVYNARCGHSTMFVQSSVYPSSNFCSGPLGSSMTSSGPIKGNARGFYSGPLVRSATKSRDVLGARRNAFRLLHFRNKSPGTSGQITRQKSNGITMSGPLTGCIMGRTSFPTNDGYIKPHVLNNVSHGDRFLDASRSKLSNPPPDTLGASALALHYANVIVFIEKLIASPHFISNDARDNLYNMLPLSIRAAIRVKLKPHAKIHDTDHHPGEWNKVISETLKWLAPLAHNMIRWQSSRSIEHQSFVSKTNVLLVQTLFFANREKTEAAITDLLVGVNNVWRFGRETDA